jgi:hypothetical protein
MAARLRRGSLVLASHVIPGALADWLIRRSEAALRTELGGKATDEFLELLLRGMDLAFCLSRKYRRNLTDFRARYVFRTRDGLVANSVIFSNGDMQVESKPVDDWDVRITFESAPVLLGFLLKGQDVLDAILEDRVEVEGNLNCVYKFGFMASDLAHMLGVT